MNIRDIFLDIIFQLDRSQLIGYADYEDIQDDYICHVKYDYYEEENEQGKRKMILDIVDAYILDRDWEEMEEETAELNKMIRKHVRDINNKNEWM